MIFTKTYEEFEEKLREHELEITCKYNQIVSPRAFSAEKAERSPNVKIHWESGIPFVRIATRIFTCHHGKDNNRYQKRKYANERDAKACADHAFVKRYNKVQLTKKLDCPAKIYVSRVIQFQEYKVLELDGQEYKKKKNFRLINEKILNEDFGEESYMFSFPTCDEHKFHLLGDSAAANEPIDARVRQHIAQLVRKGESDANVISKLLNEFVEKELNQNCSRRRRFFPDMKSIRKIVSSEKIKLRKSVIDQEETELFITLDTSKCDVTMEVNSNEAVEATMVTDLPGTTSSPCPPKKRKTTVQLQDMAKRNNLLKETLGKLSSANSEKDEASVFAESWATSFRKLSSRQQIYAKRAIEEILVLGQLNLLSLNSVKSPEESDSSVSSSGSSSPHENLPTIVINSTGNQEFDTVEELLLSSNIFQ